MTDPSRVDAINVALANIPQEHFSAWPGGWQSELGTALVDAVYSIQSKYNSADPTRGVSGRLNQFRRSHPDVHNDLTGLISLGEEPIRAIMGETKVSRGRKFKSVAIIEAAENFVGLSPSVNDAEAFRQSNPAAVREAYTAVNGLGWATFDYLSMLLGRPGVKSDVMTNRFVNNALTEAGLPTVSREETKELITAVQEKFAPAEDLTFLDHAIWLYEQDRETARNDDQTEITE